MKKTTLIVQHIGIIWSQIVKKPLVPFQYSIFHLCFLLLSFSWGRNYYSFPSYSDSALPSATFLPPKLGYIVSRTPSWFLSYALFRFPRWPLVSHHINIIRDTVDSFILNIFKFNFNYVLHESLPEINMKLFLLMKKEFYISKFLSNWLNCWLVLFLHSRSDLLWCRIVTKLIVTLDGETR